MLVFLCAMGWFVWSVWPLCQGLHQLSRLQYLFPEHSIAQACAFHRKHRNTYVNSKPYFSILNISIVISVPYGTASIVPEPQSVWHITYRGTSVSIGQHRTILRGLLTARGERRGIFRPAEVWKAASMLRQVRLHRRPHPPSTAPREMAKRAIPHAFSQPKQEAAYSLPGYMALFQGAGNTRFLTCTTLDGNIRPVGVYIWLSNIIYFFVQIGTSYQHVGRRLRCTTTVLVVLPLALYYDCVDLTRGRERGHQWGV